MDISARWQETLRAVLKAHPEVELRQGDIRTMGLPEAGFDVVLMHWMLHDIPPWDRPPIVEELARLLRPGGRLFSHEPTSPKHGMPAEEVRALLAAAGLKEVMAEEGKKAILGPYYRAIWFRPS